MFFSLSLVLSCAIPHAGPRGWFGDREHFVISSQVSQGFGVSDFASIEIYSACILGVLLWKTAFW